MYVERKEGECFLIKGAKKIIWWYRKVCERRKEKGKKKEENFHVNKRHVAISNYTFEKL